MGALTLIKRHGNASAMSSPCWPARALNRAVVKRALLGLLSASVYFASPTLADERSPDAPDDAKKDKGQKDQDEKDKEEDREVRKYASNRDMQVVAKSLRLTRSAGDKLLLIAAAYHEQTGRKLVITGGDRSAERQAELMYKKLENGEDLLEIYARDDLVREIMDAYDAAKSEERSKKGIVSAMGRAIEDQIERGQYVSRHLDFTAADVRSRDLEPEHIEALRSAVRSQPGARFVDETESVAPHIHLNLMP